MKRILLVEDELESRLIIQFMLEVLGCQVDCAHDGEEAVEMACHRHYHCILMDIGLPKLDGFKACKLIKQHQAQGRSCPLTPIVALTELMQIEHLDNCLEAGMRTILFKPLQARPVQRLVDSLRVVEITGNTKALKPRFRARQWPTPSMGQLGL
ncbi:MAG: response regulator [Tatlockia sp.]|nr:response regulator [Tatlockia sp.]